MKSKHIFLHIIWLTLFLLGMAGAVHADTGQSLYTTSYPGHYKYYSGHHWNTALAECSANPCTSADTYCDKDTINCPGDTPYKRSWTVNSFREAMAYQPYFDEGDGIYTYSGAGTFVQGGLISDQPDPKNARLCSKRRYQLHGCAGRVPNRIWRGGEMETITRGHVYQCHLGDPNNLNYYDVDGHVSLETFAARDVYFANPGGTLSIINGGLAQPVAEGGWLYIYFFYTPGGSVPISEAVIRFKVNKEMFYGWYDDIEANGLWDTDNEPPPAEGAVPDGTTGTCSPTSLSACNATDCESVGGGFWCQTSSSCVAEEADCNAGSVCSADNLSACTGPYVCDAAGLWWYNSGCHKPSEGTSGSDSDGDGVDDTIDECADTPAGSLTNNKGCPPSLGELEIPALGFSDLGAVQLVIPKMYFPSDGTTFWSVDLDLLVPLTDPIQLKLSDLAPVPDDE